jgi:hypothetical protein
VPGFVALGVFHARFPVKEKSELIQLSWSVVYGILITNALVLLDKYLLGGHIESTSMSSPSARFVFCLFGGGLLVGGLRVLFRLLRIRIGRNPKLRRLAPDPQSTWVYVNQNLNGEWAVVYTTDGAIYLGALQYYKNNPNDESQDFLLAKARRVDEELVCKYEVTGKGVLFSTKDVARIEFLTGS